MLFVIRNYAVFIASHGTVVIVRVLTPSGHRSVCLSLCFCVCGSQLLLLFWYSGQPAECRPGLVACSGHLQRYISGISRYAPVCMIDEWPSDPAC